MPEEDKPAPSFKLIDVYPTGEGLVLVHPDEAEAQRSYCEGQLRNYRLRLEGNKLIWLVGAESKTD